jgi:hypothetical protein
MPITLNDFKERVTLKTYKDKVDIYGNLKRKKKDLGTVWGAIKPLNLSFSSFFRGVPKVVDGVLVMQVSYQLYVREKDLMFDEIIWKGEGFIRMSCFQEEGVFQKCLIAKIEERGIGGDL